MTQVLDRPTAVQIPAQPALGSTTKQAPRPKAPTITLGADRSQLDQIHWDWDDLPVSKPRKKDRRLVRDQMEYTWNAYQGVAKVLAAARTNFSVSEKPTTKRVYTPAEERHSTHRPVQGDNIRHRLGRLRRHIRDVIEVSIIQRFAQDDLLTT